MNNANTVDLTTACVVVSAIAETGMFPSAMSIVDVRTNLRAVTNRLGFTAPWPGKIKKAQEVLGVEIEKRAVENARARAEKAQQKLADYAAKAPERKEVRHQATLRHQRNKLARAEANRMTAKGGGAGTQQKREGGKGKKSKGGGKKK